MGYAASNENVGGSRKAEWTEHWPLIFSAFIGFGFYSITPNALGLLVGPITDEFGWTRTEVMAGLSISAITAILLSPFVGGLIDRYGSRRIAIIGLALTGLATSLFSYANGSTIQWLAFWAVHSLVVLLIKATVWTAAVSGTFFAGRSLAIAITMSGASFAQAIVPPLTQSLVVELGWRGTYVALGLGWGCIALVPAIFFLYDAKDRLRMSDSKKDSDANANIAINLPGLSVKEALYSPPIIKICIATFLVMLTGVGILVNQVPILVESGLTREKAAYLTSLYGVAGICGKLVTGWLMDRYDAGRVGGITLAVSGCAFLLMLKQVDSTFLIVAGLVLIGYAAGCKLQLCAYLTSVYAGLRNYGKIFGVMSSMMAIGAGFGPPLAALTYDTTGSYSLFIYASCGLSLIAAALLLSLEPKPESFD